MDYGYDLVDDYEEAWNVFDGQCNNVSGRLIDDLWFVLYKLHQQKRFSKPMPVIGMYIVLASLGCVLAMVLDMLHSLQTKKMWIPCKYFTLNAVSLTAIAVAVKLPMDLTGPMSGVMDQQAKLGSVAFMCVMMSYLLPSLATMNGRELFTNIIALGVLVITLVVNVCIQINTGVVFNFIDSHDNWHYWDGTREERKIFPYANREITIIYVAMLLMLLMIYICSALMILKSKQDLESKYQTAHEKALRVTRKDGQSIVDHLEEYVINYGVMAGTGSPQFMTVCSATCSASVVIGVSISFFHIMIMAFNLIIKSRHKAYDSDYKWSILVIFIIQTIGIALGMIVLCTRFNTPTFFKLSTEVIWNFIKVYEVESCWTDTLSNWKRNRLYSFSSPKFNTVFYRLQILGLTLLTLYQIAIVTTCKAIRIIPNLILISLGYFMEFVLWFLSQFGFQLNVHQEQNMVNIRQYSLEPQDDMKIANLTINLIIKSLKSSIQNAKKKEPSKLIKLLGNSSDFEGVKKFESLPVQSSPESDCTKFWSLPVVTLATIALSLHKFPARTLKNFLNEVNEGLVYVKLVEESLNNSDELVIIQKAVETLRLEVEVSHEWLGNNLKEPHSQKLKALQIVEWFKEKAKYTGTVVESTGICADSMRRITQKILLFYQNRIDEVSQEELFDELSSMISGILAACLTNLPQVIRLKCHTSAIEKREESVCAAATLLGKTAGIINRLQDRQPPNLNPDDLPFIDKWRVHLLAPSR